MEEFWEKLGRFLKITFYSSIIQLVAWIVYIYVYLGHFIEEFTNNMIYIFSGYSTLSPPIFCVTCFIVVEIIVLVPLMIFIGFRLGYNGKEDLAAVVLGESIVNLFATWIIDLTIPTYTLFVVGVSLIMIIMSVLSYYLGAFWKDMSEQYWD